MSERVGVPEEVKPMEGRVGLTPAAAGQCDRRHHSRPRGRIETTRPTTCEARTYVEEGIQHSCVTDMPGAVPRSASEALSAAMLPHPMGLPGMDWRDHPRLAGAINVAGGGLVHPALRA